MTEAEAERLYNQHLMKRQKRLEMAGVRTPEEVDAYRAGLRRAAEIAREIVHDDHVGRILAYAIRREAED